MKKMNKKGFTIVELVIVIAVIAILAAVLIPTFSSIIKKANQSKDTQIVRNMNIALSLKEADDGVHNFVDVIDALEEAGFILSNLNPTTEGWAFIWEGDSNQMLIIDLNNNFSVIYQSKTIQPGKDVPNESWYVVCRDDTAIKTLRDSGATVTRVTWEEKANAYTPKTVTEVTEVLNNAQDGDVVALSGELNLVNVTIDKDVTFISYDGSAVIDRTTFNIVSDVNISFQNITFANAENDSNKSLVYAQNYSADLVFEGCVFEHTAYECVQITPINGSNVTVNNCTFKVDESDNDSCSAAGVHRLLHIQNTSEGTVTSKITVTNNTFIGCDRCHNAVIDIDFIEAENFIAGNNKFYKADGTEITTNSQMQALSTVGQDFSDDNAIWCCNGYNGDGKSYAEKQYSNTFDFFTGTVQSYEDFAK